MAKCKANKVEKTIEKVVCETVTEVDGVVLTLSQTEAEFLVALLGKCSGSINTDWNIYRSMRDTGIKMMQWEGIPHISLSDAKPRQFTTGC